MKPGHALAGLLVAQLAAVAAREVAGAVHLDRHTFDKIRSSHDMLVCFDKYIPYGGKHDRFKAIAKTIGELNDEFLVGWIGLQDYGDELNKDLHEKYGVSPEDFPVYKMFLRGKDEPIDYTGSKTSRKQLLKFVEDHAGVYTGGKPGCVKALDEVAAEFMQPGVDRAALRAKADELIPTLSAADSTQAQFYLKVMGKIEDKGDDYPAVETGRIQKLIDGNISDKKKDEFRLRKNVLSSFMPAGAK